MHDMALRRWQTLWFSLVVAASVFCLAATFFASHLEASLIARILGRFSFKPENNVGAWWSGILLLLGSIHALDGFFLYRRRQSSVAFGWATLSVILFLLSADELGSLHERLSYILPFGRWMSLLPFALVLSAGFMYGLYSLWKAPEQRPRVRWIVVAFLLLASVVVQEYLEHSNSQWWGQHEALRTVIEEGTEVLAMLILLKVAMSNTRGVFHRGAAADEPVFQALCSLRRPLLVLGLVSALPLAYLTAMLPDQQRGHPSDWLAAAGFLFAGLVIVRGFLQSGRDIGWSAWVASACCLIASAACVAIDVASDPGRRFLILYALTVLIGLRWLFLWKQPKSFLWILVAALACLAVFFFTEMSLFLIYFLSALVAVLVYAVSAHLDATRMTAADEVISTSARHAQQHL